MVLAGLSAGNSERSVSLLIQSSVQLSPIGVPDCKSKFDCLCDRRIDLLEIFHLGLRFGELSDR